MLVSVLTYVEHKHETTQRDYLAVVWAVLLLRLNIESTRFAIRSHNDSLTWILNFTDGTRKLAQWRQRLLESAFNFVHHASKKHRAADALSRL